MAKIKYMFFVLITILIILLIVSLYQIGNIQIRQTKDYAEMYVDPTDVIDSQALISPPENYSQLLQIDTDMRKKVAKHMEEHNYKLKSGKQVFVRNNPSFKELTEDGFVFEKIE